MVSKKKSIRKSGKKITGGIKKPKKAKHVRDEFNILKNRMEMNMPDETNYNMKMFQEYLKNLNMNMGIIKKYLVKAGVLRSDEKSRILLRNAIFVYIEELLNKAKYINPSNRKTITKSDIQLASKYI